MKYYIAIDFNSNVSIEQMKSIVDDIFVSKDMNSIMGSVDLETIKCASSGEYVVVSEDNSWNCIACANSF